MKKAEQKLILDRPTTYQIKVPGELVLIVWHTWKWPRLEETRTVATNPAGRYSA